MSTLRTAIHAKSFPKPTGAGIVNLKMKDGGPVPATSLRGMYNSAVDTVSRLHTSDAEKRANRSMAVPAAAPAPTPVAVAAPVQDIPAPMGSQSVLARREAAAGLRNGGPVCKEEGGPIGGTGKGDHIPILAEPGEFMVSNAMKKDYPGLQDMLHEMREETLAKQGMTPAEADAKAVHSASNQGEADDGPSLRQSGKGNGQGAGPQHPQTYGQSGRPEALDEREVGADSDRGLRGRVGSVRHSQAPQVAPSLRLWRGGEVPGVNVFESPMTLEQAGQFGLDAAHGDRVNPMGKYGSGTFGLPGNAPDVGAPPPKATPKQWGANKASQLKGVLDSPVLRGAQKVAGAAFALKEGSDAVDDYQSGNYVGAVDHGLQSAANVAATSANPMVALPGMAYGVGHHVGSEIYNRSSGDTKDALGRGTNNIAKLVGGGTTPEQDAAMQTLSTNDWKNGTTPTAKPTVAPTPATSTAPAAPADFKALNAASDAYNSAQNPQPATPTGTGIKAEMQPNGTMAFSGGGSGPVSYSGSGADALRKGGGTVTSMPAAAFMGSSPAADANAAALRMEAAKRGDWDAVNSSLAAQGQGPVRGTQTSGGGGGGNSPRDMIMNQLRGAGKLSVTGMKIANDVMTGDNQLRGNQMQYDSSMYGHNVQNTNNVRTNDTNMLRNDREGRQWLAEHGEKVSNSAFERQQKGNESFEKSLASLYPGEDGKGDQKQITAHRQMATNYVNDLVQTLKDSGDTKSADALAQAGPGALHTNHHAEISMAMRTRAALEKANGWMPTTGGYKDSTHPKAWKPIGYEKRGVGGDHVLFPNGHISVNDLRGTPFYNQTGGTTDFDQIITDAQAAQAKRKGAK